MQTIEDLQKGDCPTYLWDEMREGAWIKHVEGAKITRWGKTVSISVAKGCMVDIQNYKQGAHA